MEHVKLVLKKSKISLIFLLYFSFQIYSQTSLNKSLNVDGAMRTYKVYVPAIYDGLVNVPIVFNFHGYTSNASEQEAYGDFRAIADTANFILVHPQGLNGGSGTFWNSFSTTSSDNFDYKFFEAMINALKTEYLVDENRIYATGMSNGGFFSYDLACFLTTRIAAIASVTGCMIANHVNACTTERKTPIMQIHGTNDETVSYNGQGGIIANVHMDSLIAFWNNKNETILPGLESIITNSVLTDNSTATNYSYLSLDGKEMVRFIKVQNGGHTWPGSAFQIPQVVTNMDFNASVEIWKFFNQHSLVNTLTIKDKKEENNLSRKGNTFYINGAFSAELELFDLMGKKLTFKTEETGNQTIVNLENFTPGIYFLLVNKHSFKVYLN